MSIVACSTFVWTLVPFSVAAAAPPPSPPPGSGWAALDNKLEGASIAAAAQTQDQPAFPTALGSREDPAESSGGGDGGAVDCTWTPAGPIAEVQAAQAAVNAQQTPSVQDPTYVEDVLLTPTPGMVDTIVRSNWFRLDGSTAVIKVNGLCAGNRTAVAWWPLVPDGAGNLVLQVSAQDLVPSARDQVIRRLPTPEPRVFPADDRSDGFTFVQHRTFFYVDQAPGQWDVVSATASAGGISVTVWAEPVRLQIDPGDGSEPVRCEGVPIIVNRDSYTPDIEGCSHRYRHSSAMAPNGATYPVAVSIVWHATWTASTGEGGDLGYVSTTSATRDLPVAEIQALIVDTDP